MDTNTQSYPLLEQQALNLFKRHVAAFTAGDLDAVLGDFGEQSVVITPDGAFEGLAQIRALYQGLLAEFGAIARGDSPGFSFDVQHVRQDTLFIAWHAESKHHVYPYGTDTFICKDDQFARQSIAFSPPVPKHSRAR